jgi:hypothetical protein
MNKKGCGLLTQAEVIKKNKASLGRVNSFAKKMKAKK